MSSCAIKIVNSSNCTLQNNSVIGFDIGYEFENVSNLNVNDEYLEVNCLGIKGSNIRNSKFERIKITENMKYRQIRTESVKNITLSNLIEFLINKTNLENKLIHKVYNELNLPNDSLVFK